MIFDRRPFYWIAAAAGAVIVAVLYATVPRIQPEQRVHEQVSLLSREPWTKVQIERVESRAGDEAVLDGVRLDTNVPVRIQFIGNSPYTAASAMKYLSDHALDGATADVLMLPRSITWEPYRSKFSPSATHVGVAVFAGLAETAAEADAVPASAPSGDMSVETPPEPAAAPPADAPATPAPPHG